MVSNITLFTTWNYIKPMFWHITLMMMPLRCLFSAIYALKIFSRGNFVISKSIRNGAMCFKSIIILSIFHLSLFAFFALRISFLPYSNPMFIFLAIQFSIFFIFFCLLIFPAGNVMTFFTISCITIFHSSISVKFRKQFDLLAMRTSFLYDIISHIRFLSKRLWSELITRYILAVGSFYYRMEL